MLRARCDLKVRAKEKIEQINKGTKSISSLKKVHFVFYVSQIWKYWSWWVALFISFILFLKCVCKISHFPVATKSSWTRLPDPSCYDKFVKKERKWTWLELCYITCKMLAFKGKKSTLNIKYWIFNLKRSKIRKPSSTSSFWLKKVDL